MNTCGKIVHVMHVDKFIKPFIAFIDENFDSSCHHFIVRQTDQPPVDPRVNITTIGEETSFLKRTIVYLRSLNCAEKIILHSLFDRRVVYMLFLQPWLLKKCYWVMWGGDLYYYLNRADDSESNKYERIRAAVIRKIGHFVTYIQGDYELAKKWYGAAGQYHECLMYPSNTYKEHILPSSHGKTINILVGNSADPSNNHIEIFNKLLAFKDEDFLIYCPLSYGIKAYGKEVVKKGEELFGNKFISLQAFMSEHQYLKLLSEIDIAIFSHKRQQAMGNKITLLGLGKKVYMRKDVTPYMLFEEHGVKVFDVQDISLSPLDDQVRQENQERIRSYFSKASLIKQWASIFQG